MFTVNMTTIWLWIWLFFSLGLLLICAWRLVTNKFIYDRVNALEKQASDIPVLKDWMHRLEAKLDEIASRPFIDEKCRNDMKALSDFCSGTMDALNRAAKEAKEEFEVQEKERKGIIERWLAISERLDAQGARIQELEAKVKIGFPTVPEEKSPEPVDKGGEIG